MISRRKFFGMIAAGVALAGVKPRTVEYAENTTAPPLEWWQAGDYLTRPTPRDRWTRAQSFGAIRVGHEFGSYDGNGRITNYGPITFKTRFKDRGLWSTDSTMWSTLDTRTVT